MSNTPRPSSQPVRQPNPYGNQTEAPLPPSTQVDEARSPAGYRGDGARRHREQTEQVSGVPGGPARGR
ncbi:hypothetical protein [Xenophilus sp. Marseille-Q4582]|uniref:hypothetical protein n=1 Tax=Xenophilus sp. Marseille-Q4582 TaxID=2866600 RepID=UPI001CE3D832|nr:hypothetical protein [Xenophilus sp. Marseille-Q4582]